MSRPCWASRCHLASGASPNNGLAGLSSGSGSSHDKSIPTLKRISLANEGVGLIDSCDKLRRSRSGARGSACSPIIAIHSGGRAKASVRVIGAVRCCHSGSFCAPVHKCSLRGFGNMHPLSPCPSNATPRMIRLYLRRSLCNTCRV